MKLDRNLNWNGRGKYALIKLRNCALDAGILSQAKSENLMVTVAPQDIDLGDTEDSDFFVIRLKDKYAYEALKAYAYAAAADESEYANEVLELAEKAFRHPSKRKPD